METPGVTLSRSQRVVMKAVSEGKSVFFTGAAGTGKSFLLSHIIKSAPKAGLFVTASTGLAAVNIRGTTIHAFAGVGLGDGSPESLAKRVASNPHASNRWREARVLIVDELSMIDGRLLDKVEYVARAVRKSAKPFGGIQLIFAGDFLQLPPVCKPGNACFAFQAKCWERCIPKVVLLDSAFRQVDPQFIEALNSLRLGRCNQAIVRVLAPCMRRKLDISDGILPTMLYTRKFAVEKENSIQLRKLPSQEEVYEACDTGRPKGPLQALQRTCPGQTTVTLKEGAQVMLLKNLSAANGLVNGARGVVIGFEGQVDAEDANLDSEAWPSIKPDMKWPKVKFACGVVRVVTPRVWTVEVQGTLVAKRLQIPLMLGWALTVHKCQGMTLDKVIVSLKGVFEAGQAYVALSRVRSLEGMRLVNFSPRLVRANKAALAFYVSPAFTQKATKTDTQPIA